MVESGNQALGQLLHRDKLMIYAYLQTLYGDTSNGAL